MSGYDDWLADDSYTESGLSRKWAPPEAEEEAMSSLVYIECDPPAATAIFCEDCDNEYEPDRGWFDGPAAIARHNDDWPQHRRITWLRREVA